MDSMLDAALRYAAAGWAVFPCDGTDKHPLTVHGLKDAQRDPAKVREWWTRWPQAAIAIPTGAVNGVVVLDFDVKSGGLQAMTDLKAAVAGYELPTARQLDVRAQQLASRTRAADFETLAQRTQSGGFHFFYQAPRGLTLANTSNLFRRYGLPGADLRGDGGYVIVAPSIGRTGVYAWVTERVPKPCPQWLIDVRQELEGSGETARLTDEALTALWAPKGQGDRHDAMTRLIGHLLGKRLPPEDIRPIVAMWNAANTPPLPDEEFTHQLDDMLERWYEPAEDGMTEDEALETAAEAAAEAERDPGAPFTARALDALNAVRATKPDEFARLKARLQDTKGVSLTDLARAMERARAAKIRTGSRGRAGAKPQINLVGDDGQIKGLQDLTRESLQAIVAGADGIPDVYLRSGRALVRLHEEDHGPVAEELSADALVGKLDRVASYIQMRQSGPQLTRPPREIARDIRSADERELDQVLPRLRMIAAGPVVLPSGDMLVKPGYYRDSGILVNLHGISDEDITLMPLTEALDVLFNDLLVDFPFADMASRAHALLMLLQPFVRPMFGTAPLFLIDAPARGTGKTLLANVLSLVSTGAHAAVLPPIRDEEEMRKRVLAELMGGAPLIQLDNITTLTSGVLASVLTSVSYRDRVLGRSEILRFATTGTSWIATGNNVAPSPEMARRIILIRLDANVPVPEARSGWKHQLPGWAVANRGRLVSACLSVVRAWLDEGQPRLRRHALGSFEEWAEIMGGILQTCSGVLRLQYRVVTDGVPSYAAAITPGFFTGAEDGFLANREEMAERAQEDSEDWDAFVQNWFDQAVFAPRTAKELLEIAKEAGNLLSIHAGRSEAAALSAFGTALGRHIDNVFDLAAGRVRLRKRRNPTSKNGEYWLEEAASFDTSRLLSAGRNGHGPEDIVLQPRQGQS